MKKKIFYTIQIIVLFLIVSCNEEAKNKYVKDFDQHLITENENLELSGQYEALILLNKEYLKKADKIDYKDGRGLCYLNIANLNAGQGNYKKAKVIYNQAETIFKDSENNFHKANFYNDYSLYYLDIRMIDKALECSDKALYYVRKAENSELKKRLLPKIYVNRGIYFEKKNMLGSSLKNYHKAKILENSAYTNSMIGEYHLLKGNLDSAGFYIFKAADMVNHQKTPDVKVLWIYYAMGYYYNELQKYDAAEVAIKKALEIDKRTSSTYSSNAAGIYLTLSQIYEKKNDKEKAYLYFKKYKEESSGLSEVLASVNEKTDDFISEAQKESDRHENNLRFFVILSIIFLFIFGLSVWLIIKQLKLKKGTLNAEVSELKDLINTKKLQEINELAKRNDSLFLLKFKEMYPDFINSLLKINPDLENSEIAFCAMLKLHFTSKEIADYSFVQHRSIQQKKYRLRKRLNIPVESNIYKFFDDLG